MRRELVMLSICIAGSGCAFDTERRLLGYGDYVALNCDQLGAEAVRLMRQAADRSEHILQSDQDRRDKARQQLALVKQASQEKACNVPTNKPTTHAP